MSGVNTLHFYVWFSLRSPPQLPIFPSFPLLCHSLCHVGLIWICWESFLLLLRGMKPISKTRACKIINFHHSSASESKCWTDAWSPRGSLMMVITCSTCFSPSPPSLLPALLGTGGKRARGVLGTHLSATFLGREVSDPFCLYESPVSPLLVMASCGIKALLQKSQHLLSTFWKG